MTTSGSAAASELTEAQVGLALAISQSLVIPVLDRIAEEHQRKTSANGSLGEQIGQTFRHTLHQVVVAIAEVQPKQAPATEVPSPDEVVGFSIRNLDVDRIGAIAASCGSQTGAYVSAVVPRGGPRVFVPPTLGAELQKPPGFPDIQRR